MTKKEKGKLNELLLNKYQPYQCETCRMCAEDTNPLYDSGYVYCKKYKRIVSHYREGFYGTNIINHKIYESLRGVCKCTKPYPSKWRNWKFRVCRKLRIKDDIKYCRYDA